MRWRSAASAAHEEVIYLVAAGALVLGLVIGFLLGARYASGRHHLRRSSFILRRH
jgi:hypothetical protein